jgi:hypothetical protein
MLKQDRENLNSRQAEREKRRNERFAEIFENQKDLPVFQKSDTGPVGKKSRLECGQSECVSSVVLPGLGGGWIPHSDDPSRDWWYHEHSQTLHQRSTNKFYTVGKNYTRNEWGRRETTLETSGEDVKLHSKRVEKMDAFRVNWDFFRPTLRLVSKLKFPDRQNYTH